MPDMQEIGLPALTNILQGKVWIYNNQNLCYLDTIDWGKITNDTHGNGIKVSWDKSSDLFTDKPRLITAVVTMEFESVEQAISNVTGG